MNVNERGSRDEDGQHAQVVRCEVEDEEQEREHARAASVRRRRRIVRRHQRDHQRQPCTTP